LRKIQQKIAAIRAALSDSNMGCSKSFVGWGFAPDPTEGTYSAPPDFLAVFRGPTSKGGERREGAPPFGMGLQCLNSALGSTVYMLLPSI